MRNMSISNIVLSSKSPGFDSMVCLTDVQTEEDVERLKGDHFYFVVTESDFKKLLPGVDTKNIYLIPSITQCAIYFNKETLAACPCHIDFMMLDAQTGKDAGPAFRKAIKENENAAANFQFKPSILALLDGMKIDYFKLLFEKYPDIGQHVPDIYNLFFAHYFISDYGFSHVSQSLIDKIVATKRPEDQVEQDKQLKDLPDILTVYRGGSNTISVPVGEAYSWTLDIRIANFFASRIGHDRGYIAKGTVSKDKVINCCLDSEEKEIVVDPQYVNIMEVIDVKGNEDCAEVIPAVRRIYQEYRDMMVDLDFEMVSDIHGRLHEARVLLLALTIAHYLNLSKADQRLLATAAIYHDTKRDNDGEDAKHGYYSAEYYRRNEVCIDPLIAFIIEYHCRPDEEGYEFIKADKKLKNRKRARLLFDVFKDADALDRVRFGLRDLDVNQLRLPVSKTLCTVANIYLSQIKLGE